MSEEEDEEEEEEEVPRRGRREVSNLRPRGRPARATRRNGASHHFSTSRNQRESNLDAYAYKEERIMSRSERAKLRNLKRGYSEESSVKKKAEEDFSEMRDDQIAEAMEMQNTRKPAARPQVINDLYDDEDDVSEITD